MTPDSKREDQRQPPVLQLFALSPAARRRAFAYRLHRKTEMATTNAKEGFENVLWQQ